MVKEIETCVLSIRLTANNQQNKSGW